MCTKEKNFSVSSKRSQDCVAAASSFSSSSSQVLFKQQTQNCLLKFFFFSTIKKYQTFKAWNYLFFEGSCKSHFLGYRPQPYYFWAPCIMRSIRVFPRSGEAKIDPQLLAKANVLTEDVQSRRDNKHLWVCTLGTLRVKGYKSNEITLYNYWI